MDSSLATTRHIRKPNGPSRKFQSSSKQHEPASHLCLSQSQSGSHSDQQSHSLTSPFESQTTTANTNVNNTQPDEQITLSQTCLCKSHTYTTTTTRSFLSRDSAFCLCSGCRHLFGAIYHAASKWPLPLPHHASQHLKRYTDPRRPVWVYFCGTCGSQMFLYFHMMGILVAPIGLISNRDTSEFSRVYGYGFINSTGDGGISEWLVAYEGRKLLRFSKQLMRSENLAIGWNAANQAKKNTDTSNASEVPRDEKTGEEEDVVLTQCQCESISFVITRPQTIDSSSEQRARPKGTRYKAHLCACTSCRLSGGMDFTASLILPKSNMLTIMGQQILTSGPTTQSRPATPLKSLASYTHSETSTRYFCTNCAALCFWESSLRPDTVNVALGLLYSASGSRAESWVEYTTDGMQCRDEAIRREFIDAVHEGYLRWVEGKAAGL